MTHYANKEIKFLKNNYASNGAVYCANKLNRPVKSIRYKANNLGLKVLPDTMSKLLINAFYKPLNKYNVNSLLFIQDYIKESSYILGLLFADGSIYKNRITLECIKADIEVFYPIFKKTGSWTIQFRNRENRQSYGLIRTTNRPLCEFLLSMNYGPRNINAPTNMLKNIPIKLQKYFFRGLIDGDGCFHINKIKNNYMFSLSGRYDQDWSFFTNLLDDLNIKHSIIKEIRKNGKCSSVRIENKSGIIKLGDYIYKNYISENIGLQRKYNKFIKIKNTI